MNPLSLKIAEMTDAEFNLFLETTATKYQDNIALFPGLTTEATALTAAITAYGAKLQEVSAAEAALKVAVELKNTARTAAQGVVTVFANAAAAKVNYDATKLALILPVRGEPKSYADLGQVQALSATFGDNPAELDLMWNRLEGAKSYEVWLNLTPSQEAGWTLRDVSTRSSLTLTGLPRGQVVHVKVRAVGTKNVKGVFSDLVEHIVG
jgi:hypothetical protein